MTPIVSSIRVLDLDHCGIVAGIIDQMGLVAQINQELGTHPQEMISAGVAVKAMILNGLGLVSALTSVGFLHKSYHGGETR